MRSVVGIAAIVVMAGIMQVQAKPTAPVVPGHQDTAMVQQKTTPEAIAPSAWQGREMQPCGKDRGMPYGPMGYGPGCLGHMPGACGFNPGPRMWMHGCTCHHPLRLLLLGILFMGTVNVLLTIIVSLDMVRMGRFNGLWIPVILLVGIPGSVIYALFRIGDAIKAAGQKNNV